MKIHMKLTIQVSALRDRKTSEPVFLTNLGVKYEGLERSNEGLGVTFTILKVVVVVVGLVAAH